MASAAKATSSSFAASASNISLPMISKTGGGVEKHANKNEGHDNNLLSTHRFKEFFCGWAAGCVETCLLYPKNKLIFRQQLQNFFLRDAFRQLRHEGIVLLYRGILPPLIQRTAARSIMFGAFENYQRLLECFSDRSSFSGCHATAAFFAGATEACLCPLERTQVLLQTPDFHKRFKNSVEAFQSIYRQHGIVEFYRGFSLIVLRNGLSNVLFFTLREPLREKVLGQLKRSHQPNNKDSSANKSMAVRQFAANFVSGAMYENEKRSPFNQPFHVFKLVWGERDRKIRALYRGAQLNFTRSLLTWGITNAVYELLMHRVDPSFFSISASEQ